MADKEYIEREAVEKFITKGLNNPDKSKAYGYDAVEILAEVHHMDAANVVEVRRGEWMYGCKGIKLSKTQAGGYGFYIYCSECGCSSIECKNYCSNCGADCRGDR